MYPGNSYDVVSATNVYPSFPGRESIGAFATTPFPTPSATMEAEGGDTPPMDSMGHQPIAWWVTLAVLLVTLMYVAKRFDGDSSYSNLRASAYNVFVVTLTAIIGMSLFKVAAKTFPLPGPLKTVILAA